MTACHVRPWAVPACLSLAVLLLAGCGAIRSTVGIGPGEQFVLGGAASGAFSAELLNVGRVAVEVAEVTAAGDTLVRAVLRPDSTAVARFGTGSAALLRNRSDQEAAVQAVIRGDTALGMGYVPVD